MHLHGRRIRVRTISSCLALSPRRRSDPTSARSTSIRSYHPLESLSELIPLAFRRCNAARLSLAKDAPIFDKVAQDLAATLFGEEVLGDVRIDCSDTPLTDIWRGADED